LNTWGTFGVAVAGAGAEDPVVPLFDAVGAAGEQAASVRIADPANKRQRNRDAFIDLSFLSFEYGLISKKAVSRSDAS
jgi:hypothetical protein